ncbi:hypothetical protein [Piscinibacter sp.]|uniref:hypothetical protein n=1 Tax=Piscinibacter sp. TaxID=1903157 RepID=UPI0039E2F24C
MASELIGLARCPVPRCGSDRARLSLAKTGLPVLTCNACNFQGFARSDRSDQGLRALLVGQAPPAPAPEPAPAPPAPPVPAPAPAAQTGKARMSWGVMGGS